ncbi:histidinol-phosphate transaminase [Bradyrhizobium sp. STM 3809]|uniref:pyridoxal phosphate-dependent aminotransferase n=1 Tax=Bradyrhizobium sp. STM 3809 TaxID=551936 RepID=UPI0002409DE9|nr:histidinol-phosphate transaminase [Bradyrhizobium sp. STM 3809]CCE02321.1 putative histidinol-phosphate aminotransferase (HisC-like) [Bradyrhizobium sp. STM 3809]
MTDGLRAQPIQLALNETPFGPSPAAVAAIQADLAGLARYTGREVIDLTAAIAAREHIPAGQIVLGENLNVLGLYLAAQGGPGGTFIYSEPGYTALVDAVAPAGGRVIGVPLNAALENDLPAIAAAVDGATRAIYLVNPHNPSGTVSDTARFIAAVRALSLHALVIVDEAYLEFLPDFADRTVTPLLREGANVAVFRTFSKIHGLASLAIGYTLAPQPLAAALKQMGIGAFFGLSRLSLVAALASLGDRSYVDDVSVKVATEREAWHALLRARGRRFSASRANFVFFDCGRPHAEAAAALAARGIIIGRAQPGFATWLRISIGLPEENAVARQAVAELLPPD